MPRKSSRPQILLRESDRDKLDRISKARSAEFREVQRAKIILMNQEQVSDAQIARDLGINVYTVRNCLEKCLRFGVDTALKDLPRSGAPREISHEETTWVTSIACTKPTEHGYAQETWTYTRLLKFIHENAEARGYTGLCTLSRSTLWDILNDAEIKPHKVSYYLERRDPAFEEKMAQVLCIYREIHVALESGETDNTERVVTISYDEKPGIQAIENAAPDLPPQPNQFPHIARDYEYVRHGTLSLLAGINLMTGEIIADVSATHKSSDFIRFLSALDERYRDAERIRIVLDNHSAHISKETMRFLETKSGRFEFIFTPKHGSWLNLIECFFSKLTRGFLRHLRVTSKEELQSRLLTYIDEVNEEPVIFRWRYKMEPDEENFII